MPVGHLVLQQNRESKMADLGFGLGTIWDGGGYFLVYTWHLKWYNPPPNARRAGTETLGNEVHRGGRTYCISCIPDKYCTMKQLKKLLKVAQNTWKCTCFKGVYLWTTNNLENFLINLPSKLRSCSRYDKNYWQCGPVKGPKVRRWSRSPQTFAFLKTDGYVICVVFVNFVFVILYWILLFFCFDVCFCCL